MVLHSLTNLHKKHLYTTFYEVTLELETFHRLYLFTFFAGNVPDSQIEWLRDLRHKNRASGDEQIISVCTLQLKLHTNHKFYILNNNN